MNALMQMPDGHQLMDPVEILSHHLDLRQDMTYADLGVGSAHHLILTAARIVGDAGRCYGLDIIKANLSALQSRAKSEGFLQIKPIWTDLEVYGAAKAVGDESVDRMVIVNTLYQTKQDTHVFNEANRMLKPGGRCIVIDWNPEEALIGPKAEDRTSLDKVRQMAQVVKWNEIETFNPGDYHFGVIFEKL